MIMGETSHHHHHTPASSAPPAPGAIYTCPMHPEVRQEVPGACPKCGMGLTPESPLPAAATKYTCPMHPEIVRDGQIGRAHV